MILKERIYPYIFREGRNVLSYQSYHKMEDEEESSSSDSGSKSTVSINISR